jgi:hypothetical protein
MPYIKESLRQLVDKEIEDIAEMVHVMPPQERGGVLNYVFTRLLVEAFGKLGYYDTSQAVATLECCKLEWYRRVMAPYEDEAMKRNQVVY